MIGIEKSKEEIANFIDFSNYNSNNELFKALNKLGKLPNNFNEKPLLNLLDHKSDKIRYLAIKNLAKLSKITLLSVYVNILNSDENSIVRREAASAIGRLKNNEAKQTMFNFLNDSDPQVVLQFIRGLFVFKKDDDVKKKLLDLQKHPNETIQEVIKKEFKLNRNYSNDLNHTKSPDFMKNKIINGDVRKILELVPDESIHLTFTSPPYYNARDYSIYQSYDEYLNFLDDVFKEIHRITKEGRFFILNTSPIIIPRISRSHSSKRYPIPYDLHPRLVKMGWEFIDDIVWVKPEASVKNRNAGFLQHRKPLAYKPNAISEMLMVYRKKTDKLIDWNIHQYNFDKVKKSKIVDKYETTNIWKIDPTFDRVHSAVFPIELCNRVIKFYSFVDDLIFDPFAGSGTLGRASINLDRNFFLTEKETKYINRIKENVSQSKIFSKNKFKPTFLNLGEFEKVIKNDTNIN